MELAGIERTLCCCHKNPVRFCQWNRAALGPWCLGHAPTLLLFSAAVATSEWQEYRCLLRKERGPRRSGEILVVQGHHLWTGSEAWVKKHWTLGAGYVCSDWVWQSIIQPGYTWMVQATWEAKPLVMNWLVQKYPENSIFPLWRFPFDIICLLPTQSNPSFWASYKKSALQLDKHLCAIIFCFVHYNPSKISSRNCIGNMLTWRPLPVSFPWHHLFGIVGDCNSQLDKHLGREWGRYLNSNQLLPHFLFLVNSKYI